jgi:hypothetical protein
LAPCFGFSINPFAPCEIVLGSERRPEIVVTFESFA